MAGPWEAYQQQAPQAGPWERYKAPEAMPVEYSGNAPLPMDDASRMGRVQQTFQEKQAAAKAAEPGFFDKLKQAGQAGVEDLGRSLLGIYKSLDPTQATSALEAGAAPVMAGLISTPPGAASVVAGEATRKAAELSGVDPWLQAAAGTAASIAVPGGAIPRRVIQGAMPRPAAPVAKPIQEIMPQTAPAPAPRLALPEPANMVMEAGPEGITRVPPRNIVDLVDEIKKDVKQTVIDDIFEELRTGRTAAMPRREAPAQITAPRRLSAEQGAATQELAQDFAPKAPAIELPPPERPKIIMGKQGYRGAPEPTPMREPGPAVAPVEFAPRAEAPTIQDLLAKSQAKADKSIEKLGIGQRKQAAKVIPEEPPFEIPPEIQKETPQVAPQATFTKQAIPEMPSLTVTEKFDAVAKELRDINLNPDTLFDTALQKRRGELLAQRGELERELPNFGEQMQARRVKPETPDLRLETPLTPKRTPLDILKEETGAVGAGKQAGSAERYEAIQKEISELSRKPIDSRAKHDRMVDLEREAEIHKPAAIARAQAEIDARKAAPRPAVQPRELPQQKIDPYEVAEKAVREGVDRQGAYSRYVQAWGLRGTPLEMGAKEFGQVYDAVKKTGPRQILKSEKGAITFGREDPMAAIRAPHEMGSAELARKSFTKRTSKIFEDMGPTGKKMGEELADAYYTGEQRAGKIASDLDKIKAKYPNVKGEDLFQVESGKARPDVAAAYREIKAAITDPIGDEAVSLKIKVKNPITDVERAFQKRQRYVPHLIDPAKVAKNPTRLVDTIMEELIAEGMDPGKARTQAIQTVRNVSKKSGSLQYARTGKFDPDIHVTDGWEAYKIAAQGEVKRIEMLKRFGKTDDAGLLGDEIGGIRDRTANISAEAGPEAAQKAELWATRQIGMQRGEIDTVQKKAGELARNYNTLKLGFMPVTNLAAQMPMILAAGKTTRFNPIKSIDLIRKSFGKTGEGAELAKLFGTANDKFSADLLQKFETARGGPGGSAAAAFLHVTGGMKSENFIAKLAAQVGNEEAKYVIQKLIDNPASKSAQNTIRRYGLDPAKVIQDGATEQNIFRVARKFSDEVLLRGNVLDLPPAFTSESGKVFFQFKRATQVLGQQMYDAAKNDPSKLIALLAASQIGGETLLDVKGAVRGTVAALVSGDPKKITDELKLRPQGVRRILDNWAAALSFGYFGDTVMDVASGVQPKNIISGATVAASPFESGLHVTQGAGKIARGEKGGGKQMLSGLLREVPGGTFLRGLTRPEKNPRQKLLEDLGLSKMMKENRAARKELKEQLGLD